MFNWIKVTDDEELEKLFRLSPCCGARVTGTPNGNRYLDGVCRKCEKRCVRYDVYKQRFRYMGVLERFQYGANESVL